MRAYEFIFESRVETQIEKFAGRITDRILTDPREVRYRNKLVSQLTPEKLKSLGLSNDMLPSAAEEQKIVRDHIVYPQAKEFIKQMHYMDPSKKGMYVQWIIQQYLNGNFIMEDWGMVMENLIFFHQNKNSFEQKDIGAYDVNKLHDAVAQFNDDDRKGRSAKRKAKEGADKLFDDGDIAILKVNTEEAACYYGSGTKWCTAGKIGNQFDYYNARGPLYIIIDRAANDKFQWHFEDRQLMDAGDQPYDPINFVHEYPELFQVPEIVNQISHRYPWLLGDDALSQFGRIRIKKMLDEIYWYFEEAETYPEFDDFVNVFKKLDPDYLLAGTRDQIEDSYMEDQVKDHESGENHWAQYSSQDVHYFDIWQAAINALKETLPGNHKELEHLAQIVSKARKYNDQAWHQGL